MNAERKENLIVGAVFGGIFLFLYVFFSQIHSIVPYDGDDWAYLSFIRHALPLWGAWNPTRILPETVLPVLGFIAAYVVRPIVGDYVASVTITFAFAMSGIITVYSYFMYKLLLAKWNISRLVSVQAATLFLVFHFLILNKHNEYLFKSVNMISLFYYVVPALLCASLVMYFQINEIKGNYNVFNNLLKNGILLLALYYALFSSCFHSIIFIVYVLSMLMEELKELKWTASGIKDYVANNMFYWLLLIAWCVSLIFDMNGGRAGRIGVDIFNLPLGRTALRLKDVVSHINIYFAWFCFVVVGGAWTLLLWKKDKSYDANILKTASFVSIASIIMTCVYLLLLCAKTEGGYIGRSDVFISIAFWIFQLVLFNGVYLLKKLPGIVLVLPCILVISFVATLNTPRRYNEINIRNLNPSIAAAVDRDLIGQIIAADQAGLKEMTLIVPKGDNRDNWPHPKYMGGNIGRTLYKHGLTQKLMKIKIQPDEEMNKKYQLPIR